MKSSQDHLSAFQHCIHVLDPDDRVDHARGIVISLLEHLGYSLARDTDAVTAASAFILAVEIDRRLEALTRALRTASA